jgi:hypothetical protein
LKKPVWAWFPHRYCEGQLTNLKCWNCSSKRLGVKDIKSRSVESINSNGFVIFPNYICHSCGKVTSSLANPDKLYDMGIPVFVLKRCPVLALGQSCWTKELVNFVCTMMSTQVCVAEIRHIIRRLRVAKWVEDCSVYLQACDHKVKLIKSSNVDNRVVDVCPFPRLTHHCGGYGGTLGPGKNQILDVFSALTQAPATFSDRFMKSLGGTVLSADHHHGVTKHIHEINSSGDSTTPVDSIHAVTNEQSMVVSYIFTSSTSGEERSPQAKELYERFETWGGMPSSTTDSGTDSNTFGMSSTDGDMAAPALSPAWCLDLCCTDTVWLVKGGWDAGGLTAVLADIFHVEQRVWRAADTKNPCFGKFRLDLVKCFGSTIPGVFWEAEIIIDKVNNVRRIYETKNI